MAVGTESGALQLFTVEVSDQAVQLMELPNIPVE